MKQADDEDWLDARGLMCPEPIRLAQSRLENMPSGKVLRVAATDPAAPIDFEAWCLQRGHRFLECQAVEDGWQILIAKSGRP